LSSTLRESTMLMMIIGREAELYALMERAHRGEISLSEAVKQYRAKWRNGTIAEEARPSI
jgi:hypothetical protein